MAARSTIPVETADYRPEAAGEIGDGSPMLISRERTKMVYCQSNDDTSKKRVTYRSRLINGEMVKDVYTSIQTE